MYMSDSCAAVAAVLVAFAHQHRGISLPWSLSIKHLGPQAGMKGACAHVTPCSYSAGVRGRYMNGR